MVFWWWFVFIVIFSPTKILCTLLSPVSMSYKDLTCVRFVLQISEMLVLTVAMIVPTTRLLCREMFSGTLATCPHELSRSRAFFVYKEATTVSIPTVQATCDDLVLKQDHLLCVCCCFLSFKGDALILCRTTLQLQHMIQRMTSRYLLLNAGPWKRCPTRQLIPC